MTEAIIPKNETERLAELYDFDILDTETEKDFDEIVQLASVICESPISLITLIDKDRQWFKAKVGTDNRESARNTAFCSYAINQDDLMEVRDAKQDQRFHDNPFVTGQPNIRFYAGMPLITSTGQKMGTLCVLDNKSRVLTESQKFSLQILAKQVIRQMEFRKLAAKLKSSNERNSIFVQQAPNALAMFDKEMHYIAASQKWLEDYNLVGRNVIGVSHYDIFPEIGDEWKKIHKACLKGAVSKQAEVFFERSDGSSQWITWDVRPWYISDGNIGGLLMYTADITAMKEKDRENVAIREILDKTNEVARIGTWEVITATGQLSWSKVTREIHEAEAGVPLDADQGINFFKEGHSRDIVAQHFREALQYGKPYDLELELVTAKGNEVWVRNIAQAEFEKGKCKRIYGMFQDITERKKAEMAIIEARNLAEQSAVLKETFLANMSHEIRTPMNAIIGFTDLLLTKDLGSEEQEYIRIVKHSGENLMRIINDILDISKINSGMMAFEEHPLSIKELFHSLKALLSKSADEKKLNLSFETSHNIPEILLGDPTRLTQILLNLAGNAIKFTKDGSVTVFARALSKEGNDHRIEISVRDTGIGIPKDKLQHIFERFSQAESHTTRSYGGTGLGLSIAKQLVELQGGNISIESNSGKGTTITFTLPFKSLRNTNSVVVNKEPGTDFSLLNGLHLLLVDDNPINLKLLLGLLANYQTTIRTAGNGRDAIELLQAKNVDVVLMDIGMPEMNGYETTAHIRKVMRSEVPVIAMTANAMSGEREKCLRMGMNDYISKPIKAEELFEKIVSTITAGKEKEMVINLTFLRESMGGKEELVLEVLNLFLEMMPADLQGINDAVSTTNFPLIKKRAHKLTSSVLAMGATSMEILLKEMETLAEASSDIERIRILVSQLNTLYDAALSEVEYEKNFIEKSHA